MKKTFLFVSLLSSLGFSQSKTLVMSEIIKCHDHIIKEVIGPGFGYIEKDFVVLETPEKNKFVISNGEEHFACTLSVPLKSNLTFVINQNLPGFNKSYRFEKDQGRKTASLYAAPVGPKPHAADCVNIKKYDEVSDASLKWLTPLKAEHYYLGRTKLLIEELHKYYNDRKGTLLANYDFKKKQFSHLMKEQSEANNRVFAHALNVCAQSSSLETFVEASIQKNNFILLEMEKKEKKSGDYEYSISDTRLPAWRKTAPTKGQLHHDPSLPRTPKR